MKRAVLYIRVSTDEQADKGFSLASQEDQLNKYCLANNIDVLHLFTEDHSAKTFERPEFRRMLAFCKKNSADIDFLLFVKWDRFSRNTRDSYQMIYEFQRMGIEARAVEQPLDLNVPESKIMLAIYLASPEVENDRRALNVFNGMRKAKKEGRYMGSAPMGYRNSRDERNMPVIKPSYLSDFIILAFEEMATGNYSQEDVRKRLGRKGFSCSRNNFNKIIRNPVYAGLLYVPAFKDEPAETIHGRHEALVSIELFERVQYIISKKRPINTMKNTSREEFPLRGFLRCPRCGKMLTGSSGLSKTKRKYFYYHCTQGCKEIQSVNKVHEAFDILLQDIVGRSSTIQLYRDQLKTFFVDNKSDRAGKLKAIEADLTKNKERINKASRMMLDGEIDSSDFKSIKQQYESENSVLLRERSVMENSTLDHETKVDGCFDLFMNLDRLYRDSNVELKQRIVSLNFPGKLIFENGRVQTPQVNEILATIMLNTSELGDKKKGRMKNFSHSSPQVHS
jgi:site-specific DNA recombinase